MSQVLPTHLMEERLIRQQQEMEEDQRWLEKEERFLVTHHSVVLRIHSTLSFFIAVATTAHFCVIRTCIKNTGVPTKA